MVQDEDHHNMAATIPVAVDKANVQFRNLVRCRNKWICRLWTFFLLSVAIFSIGPVCEAASTSNALAGKARINSGSLNPPSQRSQVPASTSRRGDIYIAGFFPCGRHVVEGRLGRGVMPAVQLAVEHINDSPDVLHNYRLHIYWIDTEVIHRHKARVVGGVKQQQPCYLDG
ncbi:hypothetical protein B566_EDAN009813 [Ephemera danica]|nr:hypothetical protein B566_EDAN009813 [Ephemera danica]